MNAEVIIGFVNLFFIGLLAGEEFTVRYGVRGPLASLDVRSHIQFRQALIFRLRILVPIIFGLSVISSIAVILINGFDSGFGVRCAGLLVLISFILVTLFGTVPINEAALTWNPAAPPGNWRAMVSKWEQLDNVRCWAALIAFGLFLTGMAL